MDLDKKPTETWKVNQARILKKEIKSAVVFILGSGAVAALLAFILGKEMLVWVALFVIAAFFVMLLIFAVRIFLNQELRASLIKYLSLDDDEP